MKLIGVGFGRTGTTSLKAAGAEPCLHMIELITGDQRERYLPYWAAALSGVIEQLIWQGDFQGRFDDREWMHRMSHDRIDTIKASVPDERLTVWELGDGWEPLCEMLGGADVPDEEFRRLHDRNEFRAELGLAPVAAAAP